MENLPLVVLTGPTAVGKTKLSIDLAKMLDGEIISADSMQVYCRMDIGSAKIRPEETEGIPHYLIDEIEPTEEFNVVRFQEMAKAALQKIYANGHIPILVGGTGFYIQALLYDIHFTENPGDTSFREELQQMAEEKGEEVLYEKLCEVDPKAAEEIHKNNRKRVIRALEYYHQTGEPISAHNEREKQRRSPYQFLYFVLTDDRKLLYERIDKRVDQMLEEGLLEEVRTLKESGCTKDMVSMQGLGYKEILAFLDGDYETLEKAVEDLKKNTRHFAKRQLTWFRRERDVIWLDKSEFGYDETKILYKMKELCLEKGILNTETKGKHTENGNE